MDIRQFVIQLAVPVIWPLTLIALVLLLRTGVVALLTRLREGEFPGVKVKFEPDKNTDPAAEQAQQVSRFEINHSDSDGGDGGDEADPEETFTAVYHLMISEAEHAISERLRNASLLTGPNPDAAVLECGRNIDSVVDVFYFSRRLSDSNLRSEPLLYSTADRVGQLLENGSIVPKMHQSLAQLTMFYLEILGGETTDAKSAALFNHLSQKTLSQLLALQFAMEKKPDRMRETFDRVSAIRSTNGAATEERESTKDS